MTHWHDTMVDRPEADGAIYATGWTISGLAVLGTIVAVWILGIYPGRFLPGVRWWTHKGSNLGPLPCEGNALPCLAFGSTEKS